MDDITLSKDYLAAFKYARKIGNIDQMNDLAMGLLSELGIQDEKSSGEDMGRSAAQSRNRQDSHEGGKKL
jgi:hypothetical protein